MYLTRFAKEEQAIRLGCVQAMRLKPAFNNICGTDIIQYQWNSILILCDLSPTLGTFSTSGVTCNK